MGPAEAEEVVEEEVGVSHCSLGGSVDFGS